jgi:hypothetical protein
VHARAILAGISRSVWSCGHERLTVKTPVCVLRKVDAQRNTPSHAHAIRPLTALPRSKGVSRTVARLPETDERTLLYLPPRY